MIDIRQYIYDLRATETPEAAFAIMRQYLTELGLDRALYSLMTDFRAIGLSAGHGILANYPDDWMSYYQSKDFEAIDPVREAALITGDAFFWSGMGTFMELSKDQKQILGEAQEAGLNHGIGISIHGPNGEVAGMGFASSRGGDTCSDPYTLALVRLVATEFHHHFQRLSANKLRRNPACLTPRELEVLTWLARGKTASEIAAILSVDGSLSENTVKFHQKNLYNKLEVSSVTQAVVKSFCYGILTNADMNGYV